MERNLVVVTLKSWNEKGARYEPKKTTSLEPGDDPIEFAGVSIRLNPHPPIYDPTDQSPSLVLSKKKGEKLPGNMHIFEMRMSWQKPRKYIVGETIMAQESFFYFFNLGDIVSIQMYSSEPSETSHPEMLEISGGSQIGEKGAPLL